MRSAIPSPENLEKAEENKPMQVPELIMSESEKKEVEKVDIPEEQMKLKTEMKDQPAQ